MAGRRQGAGRSTRAGAVLVLSLVILGAMVGTVRADRFPPHAADVAAFNGNSCGGEAPAIVIRYLVVARLASLPATPLVVDVRRATLPPGAAIASTAAGGHLAIFVDSGTVTAEVAGAAVLTRAAVPGAGTWPDPVPIEGATTLGYGDHLLVTADAAVRVVNNGKLPALLVIARIVAEATEERPFAATVGETPVTWMILAEGVFEEVPPTPVYLVVRRVVFAAGAADPIPSENGGPLTLSVEAGTVGYVLTAGRGTVVLSSQGMSQATEPGVEVFLPAGSYAVEEWGAVSSLRNPTTERAWVVATTLVAASSSGATGAAMPSTACESPTTSVGTSVAPIWSRRASPG